MSRGTLFLVSTPIGNLEDITVRALRILEEVDLIACEDTRHSAKLLTHYGIQTPRKSYHKHNEMTRTPHLLNRLKWGKKIALISDAGTPLISDPGRILVAACRDEGISVVPIPGPVAAITALSGSGIPTDSFYFAGFLPAKRSARRKKLQEIASVPATMIFYEAPHRLLSSLEDMIAILGPRRACLSRELTKVHEEWLHGNLEDLLDSLRSRPKLRGEMTLVVSPGGPSKSESHVTCSIRLQVEEEIQESGASRKDALRTVARKLGISRREAYQQLLQEKREPNPAVFHRGDARGRSDRDKTS